MGEGVYRSVMSFLISFTANLGMGKNNKLVLCDTAAYSLSPSIWECSPVIRLVR